MRFSDRLGDAFDPDPGDDEALEGELDRDFPLGDATADTEATVSCPYCRESVVIGLDPGSGPMQEYVEDCQVCCQPWAVRVIYREDGLADVTVSALDS